MQGLMHYTRWLGTSSAMLAVAMMTGCPASDDGDGDGDTDATTSSAATSASGSTSASTSSSGSTSTTDASTTADSGVTTEMTSTSSPSTTDASTTGPASTTDELTSGTSSGSESGSETGATGVQVTANFVRTADPGQGNDAIGILYAGMLSECDQESDDISSFTLEGADFSGDGTVVTGVYENVPDGTHYIVAFLDDNENADPNDPGPDLGDLAAAEGFGPLCVEVTVSGADVTAPEALPLNLVVPF